ncbi:MAG: NAD(P)-dependent glycerol-3-phosphate dehydrogenase [Chloroflexi bacterium]|uniref:Glycerol-3-phosphate dehydrogenase [NAD(P)+] n=1 Tax=Candidatus Chlorohelix allophototropha TaxID=3003348 RepID=A0A8T7M2W1_9CHLR|nr:NAD(P)-dependent glycerol-3-phosphate dehydrogenase [Chloroflexota bacterium]WJW65920.1 NAD(P)-dependent glycerol-3-phosphate dehydrogenase [Chloroflexota bacterium L227-S17]
MANSSFVTVIGSGSWGTTLAWLVARKGMRTVLWTRTQEEAELLRADGENKRFLPGAKFPPALEITSDLEKAISPGCEMVIMAPPSGFMRNEMQMCRPYFDSLSEMPVVLSAAKGLEKDNLYRMTEVMAQEWPEGEEAGKICALSGPNLAREVAEGKPGATVIAGRNDVSTTRAQQLITSATFRVYTNPDVIGVELAGALKNIIALGAGVADGLHSGDNAKGAFLTRGMAEIGRLGVASGANPLTFLGLAGLGDLVATCFSHYSRNRHVGEELATGKSLDEILKNMTQVAEGVYTTVSARRLAARFGVEMPITEQLYQIMFEGKNPLIAITDLMLREPTGEMYGFTI